MILLSWQFFQLLRCHQSVISECRLSCELTQNGAIQKVQRAINQATRNRTVLVIAHRLSTVLTADKIVVIDKGEIVDMGTHSELLERCERYQTLYNLQFDDSAAGDF